MKMSKSGVTGDRFFLSVNIITDIKLVFLKVRGNLCTLTFIFHPEHIKLFSKAKIFYDATI